MQVRAERAAPIPPITRIYIELSQSEAEEMLRERQRCWWKSDGDNQNHPGLPGLTGSLFEKLDRAIRND